MVKKQILHVMAHTVKERLEVVKSQLISFDQPSMCIYSLGKMQTIVLTLLHTSAKTYATV